MKLMRYPLTGNYCGAMGLKVLANLKSFENVSKHRQDLRGSYLVEQLTFTHLYP